MSQVTYEIRENVNPDWFERLLGQQFHWTAWHNHDNKWSTQSGYARTQEAAIEKIKKQAKVWGDAEAKGIDLVIKGEL